MNKSKISRRGFLRLAALTLGASLGGHVLAACDRQPEITSTSAPTQPPATDLPGESPAPVQTTAAVESSATPQPRPTPTHAPRPQQVGSSLVSIMQSSLADARDLQYSDIQQMVEQAVELAGGFQDLIKEGQTVVLKPNLYGRVHSVSGESITPEVNGLITDWRVTRAVVELVRKYNTSGKIYVMDGSALGSTAENMVSLKYTAESIPGVDAFLAIETDSGDWQDFNSPGLVKVDAPDGLFQSSYYLNRKYKEADVLISLPVLKNHSYAAVTGAIKNVAIGATPANIYGKSSQDINRFNKIPHDKVNFHKWVHDYYRLRPVEFSIVDGLQGLQNGPMCYADVCDLPGDQMNMRLILAGRDAVAVDTIQALVMGWDPESVQYLKLLNTSALGNLDTAYITVVGQRVDSVKKDFAGPAPVCGGLKVYDKIPPMLVIDRIAAVEGKLTLSLTTDEKTNKVEIYVQDQLLSALAAADYHNLAIDARSVQTGTHIVKVWAYDRFLNRTEQVQMVEFA